MDSSSADRAIVPEGTRGSTAGGEGSIEDLLEQSEAAMREVGVQLNVLSGKVLEINEFHASIRNLMKKSM
jgi:hypothetical protein